VAAQHLQDDVLGADPVGQLAHQPHAPDLGHLEEIGFAGHDHRHVEPARADGILGQRLIDLQADLPARGHGALQEVALDQFLRDVHCHDGPPLILILIFSHPHGPPHGKFYFNFSCGFML